MEIMNQILYSLTYSDQIIFSMELLLKIKRLNGLQHHQQKVAKTFTNAVKRKAEQLYNTATRKTTL